MNRRACRVARVFAPAVLAWLLVSISVPSARAQTADPVRAEAAERFDRALRLVNSGDLQGGLAEFQRAYALVASPIAIFNVGLVYAALNRPVEAARSLETALTRADALTSDNVARAQSVLREQEDKIGQVDVAVNVPNLQTGVVEVDNVEVAPWPLAKPLDVASGPHVIGLISPGYAPARREVLVPGREHATAQLDLVVIDGLLAHIGVHGLVPAADVVVDGERIGKTPLESSVTVPPGTHQVEVRRPGYLPAMRTITLAGGAHAEVTIDPTVDPGAFEREGGWLSIETSESQSVVSVDGTEVGLLTGSFQVPAGVHRLHVERGGFLPAERDVDVPRGGSQKVSIAFEPTPETRAAHVSAALNRRAWGWATFGVGLAVAAGGTALALVEQNQLPGARSTLNTVNAQWAYQQGGICDPSTGPSKAVQASCYARLNDATARVSNLETGRTVGWIAAGAGGAIALTGAVLLITGDSPHKYDQKPIDPQSRRDDDDRKRAVAWRIAPEFGPRAFSLSVAGAF